MPITIPSGPWRIHSGYNRGGWTVFTPTPGVTRVVYVSAANSTNGTPGNDNYCGYNQEFTNNPAICAGTANNPGHTATAGHGPKATVAAGYVLMRDGQPDWMKLRRGDTWLDGFGSWAMGGPSSSAKMLVSSFGPMGKDRPKIRTSGINTNGFTLAGNKSHIAIVDLDFQHTTTPADWNQFGFYTTGTSDDVLIEGCRFDHYQRQVITGDNGGMTTNVTVRRCVISYGYQQGTYAQYINGLTFDECVFYANSFENTPQLIQRHHTYVDAEYTSNVLFKDCLLDKAWGIGLQSRSGARMTGCVVSRCGLGIQIGHGETTASDAFVEKCAVLSGMPGAYGNNYETRALLSSNALTQEIRDCIFANTPGNGYPVTFEKPNGPGQGTPGTVIYDGNILYGWPGVTINWESDMRIHGDPSSWSSIAIRNSDVSGSNMFNILRWDSGAIAKVHTLGCRFHSTTPSSQWFHTGQDYTLSAFKAAQTPPDTTSTAPGSNFGYPAQAPLAHLAGYSAFIGGAPDADAFMALAIQQRKGNWLPIYTAPFVNAYIRTICFGK